MVEPMILGSSLVASAAAMLALGHRIVTQLMARIDALGASLRSDMTRQFDDAERHRTEAASGYRAAWEARHQALTDRLAVQSVQLDELRRQVEADRIALADGYVSRATWLEHVGAVMIRLDKLADRLPPAPPQVP